MPILLIYKYFIARNTYLNGPMVCNVPVLSEFSFIVEFRIVLNFRVYPFDDGIVGHALGRLALANTD